MNPVIVYTIFAESKKFFSNWDELLLSLVYYEGTIQKAKERASIPQVNPKTYNLRTKNSRSRALQN